jgi:hypothetical protein
MAQVRRYCATGSHGPNPSGSLVLFAMVGNRPKNRAWLGHESLETTALYAKLDLDSLSQLAMPWPGGEQ